MRVTYVLRQIGFIAFGKQIAMKQVNFEYVTKSYRVEGGGGGWGWVGFSVITCNQLYPIFEKRLDYTVILS